MAYSDGSFSVLATKMVRNIYENRVFYGAVLVQAIILAAGVNAINY